MATRIGMTLFGFVFWILVVSVESFGSAPQVTRMVTRDGTVMMQDLILDAPEGWFLHQDAISQGTLILGFAKGDENVTLYAKAQKNLDIRAIFVNGSAVTKEVVSETHWPLSWQVVETAKDTQVLGKTKRYFVKAFMTEYGDYSYFGYSRSESAARAVENVRLFLDSIVVRVEADSLTGNDYTGKKYYFGWGAAGGGDPQMMHNEVKYDVAHTHDIFTKDIGGGYLGVKLIGPDVKRPAILQEWQRMKGVMAPKDMYVQYSSGHGNTTGLGVGVSYNDIRDNALSYVAKEIVVFTMACNSGGLVDSFNSKKSMWENWQSQGRTLMVMASSRTSENSSTGPGKDPEEPNGPNGSAGSAFGHALWKALIGYADGYLDGVKDGFLSLGEIRDFTVWKTKKVGDHTPVHTGVYNVSLIMNRVPPKEFVDSLEGGTEGLTDDEVMALIQKLEHEMSQR